MSFPALKDAQGRLDAARKSVADVLTEAGPDYDLGKVTSVAGDNTARLEWIKARNAEIEALGKEVAGLLEVKKAADNARATIDAARDGGGDADTVTIPGQRKSLGRMFIESAAYKGYVKDSGQGPSAYLDISLKTLMERTAGWDPEEIRSGRVELIATRPAPMVVDAIPKGVTTQAAIKYMEETTFTNNAAEVAEGGTYGEAVLVLTERSVPVEKVAVWLPVTDEQLEDVPQAEGYVNNRLGFMLAQRLDLQSLTGDGTPPNLKGTENVSGIQTQALGADPIPDAIFKVMRKIRDDGFAEPSVVFLRPSVWETIRLLRTTDGAYIWGHPAEAGPTTIWGVPVIQTTAVTATKAVVGDYRNFAEMLVRRGVSMQVTNAHSDYFVKGKLAIRADMRCSLVHYRPKAFGVVTGL